MTSNSFIRACKGLLVPVVLAIVLGGIAFALDHFDRGCGDIRVLCLLVLGLAAFVLQYSRIRASATTKTNTHLVCLSSTILMVLGATSISESLTDLFERPRCDIGWTTTDAVHVLVNDLENPYQSKWIGKLGPEEKFWGYHYGPGTLLSYVPAEAFGPGGVKIMNLFYLLLAFYLIAALLRDSENPRGDAASVVFGVMLACLPSRIWSETFRQGGTDILPTMLMLAGLLAIHRRQWFLAGTLAGYSVSCKILPGFLFVVLLVRWPLNLRLLAGVVTGLVPIGLAAAWGFSALANNMILFHATKPPDDTSLYAFLPPGVTRWFPFFQLAAVAGFWVRNWRRPFDVHDLATQLLMLMVVVEVFYKEIHGNHLLWFFPIAALLFAWGWRRALLPASGEQFPSPACSSLRG
jgi:hypothetical protein